MPENKKDIQRFLAMINYLCKFIPNYSEKTTLLRTYNHIHLSFDKPQIQAVENLKKNNNNYTNITILQP